MQPEHQEHLRRPPPEPLDRGQPLDDDFVLERIELVEIETAVRDPRAQIAQICDLLTAETDAAQLLIGDRRDRRRVHGDGCSRRRVSTGPRDQRREPAEDRRRRLRRQLLTHDRADKRRQMILPLPLGHQARSDPLDRVAQDRIAPHQQTPRFVVFGWCHDGQTIRNPMLYAYVSGGTLCRYAHRSIPASSLTHDPPRTMRMLPVSGPRGSRSSVRAYQSAPYQSDTHSHTLPHMSYNPYA